MCLKGCLFDRNHFTPFSIHKNLAEFLRPNHLG